jgi:hypothetical protein
MGTRQARLDAIADQAGVAPWRVRLVAPKN